MRAITFNNKSSISFKLCKKDQITQETKFESALQNHEVNVGVHV